MQLQSMQSASAGPLLSLNKQSTGGAASKDEVSPAFAAQIVKQFILPMFETDERRSLKSKYNKMTSIRAATGNKLKTGVKFKQPEVEGRGSVYGELKLSEKLAEELDQIKTYVDDVHEGLEEAVYERDELRSLLEQAGRREKVLKREVEA